MRIKKVWHVQSLLNIMMKFLKRVTKIEFCDRMQVYITSLCLIMEKENEKCLNGM
ncbi:hypothetical protein UFO1_1034 [Pelosinus sp. UFO1]|nr:hypothetical protein UFO1_1034 [Pelosinus sp. UFO1]